MTSACYCKDGPISYSLLLLYLLSPNLDINDEFVCSRSSYFLKNGKTVREPSMMESLILKLLALPMSITFLFSINVTKLFRHFVTENLVATFDILKKRKRLFL